MYDGYSTNDRDGLTLTDVHKARREALQLAADLLDDEATCGRLGEDWRMAGNMMFRMDFIVEASTPGGFEETGQAWVGKDHAAREMQKKLSQPRY